MKTSRITELMAFLFPLVFAATLFALQTLTQSPGPSFMADYYEVSHKRGNAPDEPSRGRRVLGGRYWRDAKGRLRQDVWEVDAHGKPSKQRTFISDPAQNLDYHLESDKKVAYRSKLLPDQPDRPANPPPADAAPSVDTRPVKTELGTQTIEGFSCNGYKSCYLAGC